MILKEKALILKEKALSLLGYFFKPNNSSKGLVCVQINKEGLSIVLAKIKPSLQILNCQYFSGGLEAQQNNLSSFVIANQLQNIDCHGVLSLEDYRLILIEKPKVAENEMGEATKWLVKDLIDFPIEEAVIDFFPAPNRTGQPERIYVVVTRLQWLNQVANTIAIAGLNLKSINIAALALRNILSSLRTVGNSAVFLMRSKDTYYILVVKDQLIYLERKLELSAQNELDTQLFESFCNELVNELQHSIDFYQNRDKTIPIKIFLDPLLGKNQKLVQFIETALSLQVEVLDTSKLLCDISPDDRIKYLSVLGEALGLESNMEAT